MSQPLVHHRVDRAIATITLDSPENRNALSQALLDELEGHLADTVTDDAVRAVVLTHTGNTFCAGADLSEARNGSMTAGAERLLRLLRSIVVHPKPVIAHVNGHARAGGLGLLGACDIVIAGPRSTFAFSEARIGLAPAVISLTTLPRLTDRAAGRYYLTGEVFDADEAARIGLVTDAAHDPDITLTAITDALRRCSPQGLAESKKLTARPMRDAIDVQGPVIAAHSALIFGSDEAREGMRAFMEKRPPLWSV
ncbi:enoyl-CoA hydratase family protein [Streptomyces malaysiensis]|uniref:Enoyl-CoA hydratase/carnithine racemase n=1 Tax=Streptomyces malaysiensis TaxID=92644 RepID=A0A7X5XA42_STRMQ|nr:enoyl-CoA hydratase family protein [Streptomyces malaysiensis]NIY69287.1 enoyl-CoA hydratase/carnithine racemase [Streptomyces malaysiensis]